jgi:carbamoyltransferase
MIVIGFNGVEGTFHDSSASVFLDGELVFSVEEERLNRQKHSGGIPRLAVQACLDHVGAKISEVDAFGFYLEPEVMYQKYFLRTVRNYWPKTLALYRGRRFFEQFREYEQELRAALTIPTKTPLHFFNHHLCHAASAFHFSAFDDAAILVIDGTGDDETASLYVGDREGEIQRAATFSKYPQSLGFFYATVADYIGLGWIEGPGKLMGLAPYGKPRFYEQLKNVVFRNGEYDVDMTYFRYHLNDTVRHSAKLAEIFGVPPRDRKAPLMDIHADIACSAQRVLEDGILYVAAKSAELTRKDKLCYAGGVALNIDANSKLYNSGLFSSVEVHPASYDGGTSIGAAYLAHRKTTGQRPKSSSAVFLGTMMDLAGLGDACASAGFEFRVHRGDEHITRAAERLARREIIGWVYGRMEVGPRALTHRSILAHPGLAREEVNKIKMREGFRPFAPIVQKERLADYFYDGPSESPCMLFKYSVKQQYREELRGVVHVDNSSRVQTIDGADELAPTRELLARFEKLSGIPILLNTSFNLRGEPLVNSYEDVLNMMEKTELAAAFLGNVEIVNRRSGAI